MFIECQKVTKKFGTKLVLDNVDLSIKRNSILCLQGANGAGKTTLIKLLCDLYKINSGKIIFENKLEKHEIGYVSQHFSLYEDLTVFENISFFATLYGLKATRNDLIEHLKTFGLQEYIDYLGSSLSGGWKQKLSIACATVHEPTFLILDEPTAGVDPVSRKEIWAFINELRGNDTTILVTTHYMNEVMLCDEVAFLNNGKILLPVMPPEQLLAQYEYQDMEDLFYDAVQGVIS